MTPEKLNKLKETLRDMLVEAKSASMRDDNQYSVYVDVNEDGTYGDFGVLESVGYSWYPDTYEIARFSGNRWKMHDFFDTEEQFLESIEAFWENDEKEIFEKTIAEEYPTPEDREFLGLSQLIDMYQTKCPASFDACYEYLVNDSINYDDIDEIVEDFFDDCEDCFEECEEQD